MVFNKKITIQLLSETQDAIGQDVQTWTDIGSFWADTSSASGGMKEYYAAAQVSSNNEKLFKVRYSRLLAGFLSSQLRILYGGLVYDVKHIEDVKDQHRTFEIRAENRNGVTAVEPSTNA